MPHFEHREARVVCYPTLIVTLICILVPRAWALPQNTSALTRQQLTKPEASSLQDRFFEAMVTKNQQELDALSANDLTYNHVGGLMQSKTEFLSWVADRHFVKFDFRITSTFLYQDTTILTGRVDVTSKQGANSEVRHTPYVLTTVWSRNTSGWQLVLVQFTGVSPDK